MPVIDLTPFNISLKLAAVTTCMLLLAGIPSALMLEYSRWRIKVILEILITLPMVLPPTVMGFYLIVMLSPRSTLGSALAQYTGIELLFSFPGLVIASSIHSLPYMIQPIKNGLSSMGRSLIEASYTLGKSRLSVLLNVILPNIRPSLFTGVLMTFMHVMGEFGVVLMIGGSIPGRTKVASIALYEKVETMNFYEANYYAGVLVGISIIIIILLLVIRSRTSRTV